MSLNRLRQKITYNSNEKHDLSKKYDKNISIFSFFKSNYPKKYFKNNKTSTSMIAFNSTVNNSLIQSQNNNLFLYPKEKKEFNNQPNSLEKQINQRIINKMTPKLNTSSSFLNNQFLNKSKDLIDLICKSPQKDKGNNSFIKRKMPSLIKEKKSHNKSMIYSSKNTDDIYTYSNKKKTMMRSHSQQKFNELTKLLNKESGQIIYCGDINYLPLFNLDKPDIKERIKDKIFDLKKFKFSINYQERKDNPEKRKEFIQNNLYIIDKIKNSVNEGKLNQDEDINIDDLIEESDKKCNVREFNIESNQFDDQYCYEMI